MPLLNRIWVHWLSQKRELLILSVVLIFVALLSKVIAVEHYQSLGWIIPGVSPWAPYFVLVYALATMGILYLRRIKSIGLWGIAIIALFYAMLLFWIMELSGQNAGLLRTLFGW